MGATSFILLMRCIRINLRCERCGKCEQTHFRRFQTIFQHFSILNLKSDSFAELQSNLKHLFPIKLFIRSEFWEYIRCNWRYRTGPVVVHQQRFRHRNNSIRTSNPSNTTNEINLKTIRNEGVASAPLCARLYASRGDLHGIYGFLMLYLIL